MKGEKEGMSLWMRRERKCNVGLRDVRIGERLNGRLKIVARRRLGGERDVSEREGMERERKEKGRREGGKKLRKRENKKNGEQMGNIYS